MMSQRTARKILVQLISTSDKLRKANALLSTVVSRNKIDNYLVEHWDQELQDMVEEAIRLAKP